MYLFQVDSGIGNQLQRYPVWRFYKEIYSDMRIVFPYRQGHDTAESFSLFEMLAGEEGIHSPDCFVDDGDEVISCIRNAIRNRSTHTENTAYASGNEFDNNCSITDVTPESLCDRYLPAKFPKSRKRYDVIICNGGLNSFEWLRKRYQRYHLVIKQLQDAGYSVGCVGLPNEYVYPADNLTGNGLIESAKLISSCKLFISNDTGLYHFANLIGKPNIVIFTATNVGKNYNEHFHRCATVVESPCECAPCQKEGYGTHERWHDCQDYICGQFNHKVIVDEALFRLGKSC